MNDIKFEDYRSFILDEIRRDAVEKGQTPGDSFLDYGLDRLSSMGELSDPQIRHLQKTCRSNRTMSFDAYGFDTSDKSFVLLTNDFSDRTDAKINKADIDKLRMRMINFVQEIYDGKVRDYFDKTDDMIFLGDNLYERMHKKFIDYENDDSIDKIKLFVITNKILSERITSFKCEDFQGKKVELNVWSIRRFYELDQSGKEREAIIIDTNKFGLDGIPFIKAQMSGNLDYDAYLAIVPGIFLHKIYYEFGSRLLEGNVRTFLSIRGKVNKGIRKTIHEEPTKFFAYNNGIACTASNVKFSYDNKFIISMEDLQIINGGQTTASLTSAVLKDKKDLENIFVPVKLTVIKDEDYETMIQNISKYANSQNSVKTSDLFSNHPFHRCFEALSKKIPAPMSSEDVLNTYWFYERSRGKYEQEQFKCITKKEKNDFAKKFPKNQRIKKEELAKYYTCAEACRPDIVSKGGEKCMSFFAEIIDKEFNDHPNNFNNQFYKKAISYAILFKTTDRLVRDSEWFRPETYSKPYIVAYTISKIITSLPSGYCLDFDRIWKKQELYDSLISEIERVAYLTNRFINGYAGNIREFCTKEETWKKYKSSPLTLNLEKDKDLCSIEYMEQENRILKKEKKSSDDTNLMVSIYELGSNYWSKLCEEGMARGILSPTEIDLLNVAIKFAKGKASPSDKQLKSIWAIRNKLDDAGVLV